MSSSAIVFLHPAENVFKFHSVTYSHVNATLGFFPFNPSVYSDPYKWLIQSSILPSSVVIHSVLFV